MSREVLWGRASSLVEVRAPVAIAAGRDAARKKVCSTLSPRRTPPKSRPKTRTTAQHPRHLTSTMTREVLWGRVSSLVEVRAPVWIAAGRDSRRAKKSVLNMFAAAAVKYPSRWGNEVYPAL